MSSSDGSKLGLPLQPARAWPWDSHFATVPSGLSPATLEDTVTLSILCDQCQGLRDWIQSHWADTEPYREDYKFLLHDTCAAFRTSYQRGCHLCTLLWRCFTQRNQRYGEHTPSTGAIYVECHYHRDEKEYYLEPFIKFDPQKLRLRSDRDRTYGDRLYLRILQDDLFRKMLKSSSHIYTNSTAMWRCIQGWMRDCLESHPTCRGTITKPFLPTRLIDVGTDDIVPRLVDTKAEKLQSTPYLTLSYCWGGKHGLTLCESTLETLKAGIPTNQLPRTIQDAVSVTRKLGFRYLWVDSLCIIQDSDADWTKEAASICDVYRNCLLTIAAVGASDANQGLFAQRDPLAYLPCWMLRNSAGNDFFLWPNKGGTEFHKVWFSNAPLHQRGWVVQERVLPRRTLNFGVMVAWECCETLRNEPGFPHNPDVLPTDPETYTLKRKFLDCAPANAGLVLSDEHMIRNLRGLWMQILMDYTKAKLTISSDRLIAISGIIKDLHERTLWNNFCGLWAPFMTEELLWAPYLQTIEARIPYEAPTWSWMSINTDIWNPASWKPGYDVSVIVDIEVVQSIRSTLQNTILQPTEVQVLNLPGARSVASGTMVMRIRGPIFRLGGISLDHYRRTQYDPYIIGDSLPPKDYTTQFRPDVAPIKPEPHFFLPIKREKGNNPTLWGLALVRSTALFESAYERIGLVEHRVRPGDITETGIDNKTTILLV